MAVASKTKFCQTAFFFFFKQITFCLCLIELVFQYPEAPEAKSVEKTVAQSFPIPPVQLIHQQNIILARIQETSLNVPSQYTEGIFA